jgi:hydroxymethylglutaryl-CoA reductase (NADPH)
VEGNHVYLIFEFTTGDAAGQNMVTIATEAIISFIQKNSPIQPRECFIEANHSGDKKASAQSFLLVRGKKVSAEVTLPADLIKKRLNTTAEQMANYWRMSALGGVLSGTLGTLEILGLAGAGNARALAEVCAGVCLAGELSIIGALTSGAFSRAHRVLARTRKTRRSKREPRQHA